MSERIIIWTQCMEKEATPMELGEAAYYLRQAWKNVFGNYPSDSALAILWSQSALETGRYKQIYNWNWGNIKKRHAISGTSIKDDGHYFFMNATGENLWNQAKKKSEWKWFDPPHYQTHFIAHLNALEGAEHHIRFLSQRKRYLKAWQFLVAGDTREYSYELGRAGYYTANPETYTKGVMGLFNEFMREKDNFYAYEPLKEEIDSSTVNKIPIVVSEPKNEVKEVLDTEIDLEPPEDTLDTADGASVPDTDPAPPPEPLVVKETKDRSTVVAVIALIIASLGWLWQLFF